MALNDSYKILYKTQVGAQRFLNVFWYQNTTGGTGGASELGSLFLNFVSQPILAMVSSITELKFCEVYNNNTPTDFAIFSGGTNGGRLSTYDTTHTAYSFTLVRARTDHKSGGKRFGACADGDVLNGGWVSGLDPLIANVSAWLVNPLVSSPTGTTWRPRLRAVRYTSPGLYTYNPISSAPILGVTSQNTRKFYTGPGW